MQRADHNIGTMTIREFAALHILVANIRRNDEREPQYQVPIAVIARQSFDDTEAFVNEMNKRATE
jgi:hypothetical protein